MWNLNNLKIFFIFITFLFSCIGVADTLSNMIYSGKLAEEFEAKLVKNKFAPNFKAKEVSDFIKKLEIKSERLTSNKYNLSYLINTLKIVKYEKFDISKCQEYQDNILYQASYNNTEIKEEDLGIYTFHALKILSMVCNDSSLMKFNR